jgi:hypothetical protein
MANALNGVFMTRLSKLTLDALLTAPLPITSFWTDFSADVASYGNAVTTRYPNALVAQNFLANKNSIDSNTVSRTITLDKYIGVPIAFTDTEVSFSDIQLTEMFIKPALTTLFENVMATQLALVTVANFSSNNVIASTDFTAANVARIARIQTAAKVPLSPRHMIVPPTYAETLKTQTSVQAAYAYGPGNTIREGVVPKVYGYDIHEWNGTIPTTNNLAAIAFYPQSLLLAVRPPALPRNWYGEVRNVTMPDTGLTVQIRDYYDGVSQRTEWCFIYGCQIGNPGGLTRILSAAE